MITTAWLMCPFSKVSDTNKAFQTPWRSGRKKEARVFSPVELISYQNWWRVVLKTTLRNGRPKNLIHRCRIRKIRSHYRLTIAKFLHMTLATGGQLQRQQAALCSSTVLIRLCVGLKHLHKNYTKRQLWPNVTIKCSKPSLEWLSAIILTKRS